MVKTDNVCTESLSVDLTRPILDASTKSVTMLAQEIERYNLQSPTIYLVSRNNQRINACVIKVKGQEL